MPRAFIPFGDMTPDLGAFNNSGLSIARDVVPISGGYAASPVLKQGISPLMDEGPVWAMSGYKRSTWGSPTSFYVHSKDRLQEHTISSTGGTKTDRSRTTGSIVTATLGAGGAGYAANDTGTINAGAPATTATYRVLTVGGGGNVLTFQITGVGLGYSVAVGVPTVVTTGAGNGAFTVNITAISPYASTLSQLLAGGQFSFFGKLAVYANKIDALQYRDAESGTAFAKLNDISVPTGSSVATGDPRARCVSWIKNHLVLGNIDLTTGTDIGGHTYGGAYGSLPADGSPNNVVWWSATDNIRRFSNPVVHPMIIGSDYQPLSDDLGPITALSPGGDWINIFKENGIYIMTGPPFSFELVTTEIGCSFPHSVVRSGDDIFFWSIRGPCVLRNGRKLEYLVGGRIEAYYKSLDGPTGTQYDTTFTNILKTIYGSATTGSPNFRSVEGAVSQIDGIIAWNLGYEANIDGALGQIGDIRANYFVYYNVKEDRWSVSEIRSEQGAVLESEIIASGMCSYSSVHSGIDDHWSPGMGIAICTKNTINPGSYSLSVFHSALTYSTSTQLFGPFFATENLKLSNGGASRITKVKPVFQVSPYAQGTIFKYRARVTSSNSPSGAVIPSSPSDSSIDDHGWILIPNSIFADYNRIGIYIYNDTINDTSNISNIFKIQGVEIEYEVAGVRGKPN